MAKTIRKTFGDGILEVSYDASGNGEIRVVATSQADGLDRSTNILVHTDQSPVKSKGILVIQSGLREKLTDSEDEDITDSTDIVLKALKN